MWSVNGQNLTMVEGDWGLSLPLTVSGVDFANNDTVRLTIKDSVNGTTLIEKEYTDISENTVDLNITEEESEKLTVGGYVYSLDWYQDGAFMCNIIPFANLRVVEKA